MVPVLLQSNSDLTLASVVGLPAAIGEASSPRGRKRTNETLDGLMFAKRNSNSDMSDDDSSSTPRKGSPGIDDERRAHHNELERRRRDHIKDHFTCLKDTIPLLEGEKSSRALILKRAVEYINLLHTRLRDYQSTVEDLTRKVDTMQQNTEKNTASPATVAPSMISAEQLSQSCLLIPTTSAGNANLPSITLDTISTPSTSPFAPVVPSAARQQVSPLSIRMPVLPSAPAPSPNLTELAMLIALNSKAHDAQIQNDIASLLSFNSLALREQSMPIVSAPKFVSPLLF